MDLLPQAISVFSDKIWALDQTPIPCPPDDQHAENWLPEAEHWVPASEQMNSTKQKLGGHD